MLMKAIGMLSSGDRFDLSRGHRDDEGDSRQPQSGLEGLVLPGMMRPGAGEGWLDNMPYFIARFLLI
jgi:hypothetical protein